MNILKTLKRAAKFFMNIPLFWFDKLSFLLNHAPKDFKVAEKCVCGSAEQGVVFYRDGRSVVRCAVCGLHRNYPSPRTGVCDPDYQQMNDTHDLHPHQLFLINKIEELLKHDREKPVLDIGCSTGNLMRVLIGKGYKNVRGLEMDGTARQMASAKGLSVAERPEELPGDLAFSVIYLNHVLEHIPELDSALADFRKKLKKDGYLVIAVPNIHSFLARRAHWIGYQFDQHFWHFTPDTLNAILKRNGMKNSVLYTLSSPFWQFLGMEGDSMIGVYQIE